MKGLTHEQSAKLRNEIVEYRKQGHYIRECCEHFGVKESYVLAACRGITYPWKYDYETCRQAALKQAEARTADEQTIINAINANTPTLEYVSGYTENDGSVMVRSKVCGHVFETSCVSIRHGKTKECPECRRIAKEREERKKRIKAYERERTRRLRFKSVQLEMGVCQCCGAVFVNDKRRTKFCSEECMKKQANSVSKDKRLKKMRSRIVDRDITLKGLYRRDKGRCQICGMICDWNDYEVREGGAFIANGNYPSIDHIVPLAKGGKHEWANIQLACRKCNTIKSDRILPSVGF